MLVVDNQICNSLTTKFPTFYIDLNYTLWSCKGAEKCTAKPSAIGVCDIVQFEFHVTSRDDIESIFIANFLESSTRKHLNCHNLPSIAVKEHFAFQDY